MTIIPLSEIKPGQSGTVQTINGKGPFFTRLRELGLRTNKDIALVQKAPLGCPIEVRFGNLHSVALRKEEAAQIMLALA
ncbi:MAG: hypothetical protein COX62_03075 [Deltaproteobacteria bacterium CG_4_10_14_0_2_um_filter_43_8]|nr:MAG: hypothetical protein COV43_09170 [Deltaproteobacteria bacterium CG11_big_fil_rev_8_21_14_0_20_42_23]PJA21189.1 MAG: hypothetical protein COX62_03075 [Deltaproteobacteria bacterium CG_4_10_14_0_2_um_filter_43_8]PJC64799.1 MAG: hypothetical protein CO021_02445 [Deltaproteobacteria bacterium CG_4_9_14_0_2_um_filter_42_21]